MAKIPAKVSSRLSSGLKRFQPILDSAHSRDVSEADTVTIVKDILAEVLGYDKYSELTSEHLIRGTYCDLAVQLDRLNNKRLKVGDIKSEDGAITADIVTIDNSLVQRLKVDRHTGAIEYQN